MKTRTEKRINKSALLEYSLTLLMGTGLYLLASTGCSKVANYPVDSTTAASAALCPPGVGGSPANCCNASGLVIPLPAGCPNPIVGNGGIKGSLVGGAIAAGTTVTSAGAATSLASNTGAANPFAKLSAATAGGGITTPLVGSGLPSTASPPSMLAGAGAAAMNRGGGGGGSGGAAGLSDVSTAAAAPSADGTLPDTNVDPNVAGSAYAGGGTVAGNGGARGGNPGLGMGSLFGNAGGADASGSNAQAELGFGDRSPASAMGSMDPEDYFSRIDLNDSLFKRVETRYRNKQLAWASTHALQMSQPLLRMSAPKTVLPK